ncbi:hypothetical protein AAFC00_003973 [Neodothiora populina]|uniref:C4-dicarboxylate transporter/malic acid transport protein n=1 Tax=Neodothiora populina TaxID=2781224 RepID=A0ABR3PJ76_9PEZI
MAKANLNAWVSGWHWRDRILNFEPSWFTIIMGTGVLQTCYVNFPYPITGGARWLRDIGYCLWILEVVLFAIFIAFLLIRYISHPELFKKNLLEFPNSSYLGAIAISWNTIIQGIVSYYDYRSSAVWVCFVMYWMALAGSVLVTIGIIIVQMVRAQKQDLSDVAGVWVMTTVPLFATASTAGVLLPFINRESTKCAIAVLVTGYMGWFTAICELMFILSIFFYRLISLKLPAQPVVASSFLPIAALSQAAFAIHKMSVYLSNYLVSTRYGPTQSIPPPLSAATIQATAEAMHWLGILLSLGLLAHATFWVCQATAGILFTLPIKSFNIAHWSLVFPLASYANAWSLLSRDLRNDGMRGWAATFTVITTVLWLFCSMMTCYHGFWKGSLFTAPGLEDWLGDRDDQDEESRGGRRDNWNGTYTLSQSCSKRDLEDGVGPSNGDSQARRRN